MRGYLIHSTALSNVDHQQVMVNATDGDNDDSQDGHGLPAAGGGASIASVDGKQVGEEMVGIEIQKEVSQSHLTYR